MREAAALTDDLHARVRVALQEALSLSAQVTLLPPQSIPRSEGKALRVLDRRRLE